MPHAKIFSAVIAGCVALLAAGCTTTPKAEVVRFHQNGPAAGGTIDIRPLAGDATSSLEFGMQAAAVASELRARGFTIASTPGTAQFTALVDLATMERAAAPRRSGLSIGIGGGFSSGNVGIGTGVNVPVGQRPTTATAATTILSVRITRQPDGVPVWEGRASLDTEPGGQQGTALATVLARALFTDYPGPSGQTVPVPIR